jgi:hypothetical protein
MSDNIFILETESSSEDSSDSEQNYEPNNFKQKKNIEMKLFQHTNYKFDYRTNHSVLIDFKSSSDDSHADFTEWSVNLSEDFIVDRVCDIYLDNITLCNTTHKNNGNLGEFSYFLLSVEQFNIKPSFSSTNQNFKNKLIIPNDLSTTTESLSQIHKSKKLNYISTIQPTIINKINGTITSLEGNSIWFESSTKPKRMIIEFVFQFRNN